MVSIRRCKFTVVVKDAQTHKVIKEVRRDTPNTVSERRAIVHLEAHYGQKFYIEVQNRNFATTPQNAQLSNIVADVDISIPHLDINTSNAPIYCAAGKTTNIYNITDNGEPFKFPAYNRNDTNVSAGYITLYLQIGESHTYTFDMSRGGSLSKRMLYSPVFRPIASKNTSVMFKYSLQRQQESSRSNKRRKISPDRELPVPDLATDSPESDIEAVPIIAKRRRTKNVPSPIGMSEPPSESSETPSTPPVVQTEQASSTRSRSPSHAQYPQVDGRAGTDDPYLDSLYVSRGPSPVGSEQVQPEAGPSRPSADFEAHLNGTQSPPQLENPANNQTDADDAPSLAPQSPPQLGSNMDVDIEEVEDEKKPLVVPTATKARRKGRNEERSQAALVSKELEDVTREINALADVVLMQSCKEASLPAGDQRAKRDLQTTIRVLKQDIEAKKEKQARLLRDLQRVTNTASATSQPVKTEIMDLTLDDD
ncbi:hypothetical protein EIP91_008685 [Steccherinum ochraceum]|uniref:Uncharacterized protein n=1 Tax=Steccherinum ochraceum TaxID=92696 RepID=A0A4R0RAN5_9APHY|nr:hypothetical protein EIP91_008685 [Steccherinum ochraceum]